MYPFFDSDASRPPCRRVPLAAFLFDVDGVLADTADLHLDAWRRLALERGVPFNERDAAALRGLSRDDSLRQILRGQDASAEEFAALADRKNEIYLDGLLARRPHELVLPGVLPLLDHVAALGLRLAAVSSSRNARRVLGRIALMDRFDAVVDGNEARRAKPAPDLFLHAAAKLRVRPDRCVVVEDAASGVAAARAAGMRSVGVGDARSLCAATLVVSSLDELSPADLIARLGAVAPWPVASAPVSGPQ